MRRRPLPRLQAIALAAVALSFGVASCGGDDSSAESDNPRSLLATAASKPIESADVRLRAKADVPGFPILGERLTLTGSGPIVMNGPDALPTLDWKVELRAGGQSFPAQVSAVDGQVFVFFMGLAYEADRDLIERLGIDGATGAPAGASLEQLGIDPSGWLRRTKVADGDEIGGDSTRVVTGTVDKQAVIDDLLAIVDIKGVREQLDKAGDDAGELPELDDKTVDEVADAIEDVDVEVNVDDDGYPRRVFADLRFVVPKSVEDTAIEGGAVTFELVLDQVGDVTVDVQPPVDPDPLSDLIEFARVIFGVEELSDLWRTPR
jgi:hypothetical protein